MAVIPAAIIAGLASPQLHGAILNTSGAVTVNVQEFLDGAPASFSSVQTVFPDGETELPISASTRVESTDLDELLVAIGQGVSELSNPTLLNQQNPEELSLEIACYSNADNVSYSVIGSSVETRTIVFTSPGNPLAPSEFQFRRDGTREIESRVFLSGAMIIWTPKLDADIDPPNGSLEGLLAEISLTVSRSDTGDDNTEGSPLFATSFSISGAPASLEDPVVVGPIVSQPITLEELILGGLDAATAAMLAAIETEGSLTMIAFPSQQHAYRYVVRADESFELTATMTALIRNVPGGSGIAVALGRPFSQLIDFVENALIGSDGESVERTLNAAVARRHVGLVSSAGGQGSPARRFMCGALGAEVVPMLAVVGFVGIFRRRWQGL